MVRSAGSLIVAALLLAGNAPEPGGAIVVYRGGGFLGAAVACPIRYKGQEIVELGRGRKAEFTVAPGRYILNNKASSVEVNVVAGETRYVRCEIKSGSADLQIVDEESYRASNNLNAVGPPVSLN